MSDVLKNLMNAYYTDVTERMQTGGALEYIQAIYLLHPNDVQFLDWSSPAPFLLIYVNDFMPEPDSQGCLRSDIKRYPITLSYFVEFPDENLGYLGEQSYDWKGVIDAYEDLFDLYNRNTFSNTSIECVCTNISFQRLGGEPLAGYHQCHITFQHTQIDRRAAL